jgi:hypothetical protein
VFLSGEWVFGGQPDSGVIDGGTNLPLRRDFKGDRMRSCSCYLEGPFVLVIQLSGGPVRLEVPRVQPHFVSFLISWGWGSCLVGLDLLPVLGVCDLLAEELLNLSEAIRERVCIEEFFFLGPREVRRVRVQGLNAEAWIVVTGLLLRYLAVVQQVLGRL